MFKYGYAALIGAGLVSIAAVNAPAQENGFVINGYLGAEIRAFPDNPEWAGQDDRTFYPSLYGQLDMSYTWDGGRQKIQFTPFGRYDVNDDRRTHADAREFFYSYKGDGWDALIGLHQVFWGRAESRHLVNVINQLDLVENFDAEEYLGQPMLNVNFFGDWGKLGLYVMTGFRERTFPANDSRLRGPTRISRDALYESDNEEWNVDFAARYENTFGPLDVGLSYFHGTNREPLFLLQNPPSGPILVPFYEIMDQVGADAAYAVDNWLLKAEAIYRWGKGNPFFATVFGAEYTIKEAFKNVDIGLLLEYNFDDRDATNPGTIFDNDVFGGIRVTLNDETDTTALVGALVDVENGSSYIYLESSTRISDNWRAGVEARVFASGEDSDPIRGVDNDSYVQFRIARYF